MLIGWEQIELAKRSRVAIGTIRRMESFADEIGSRTTTLSQVQAALEKAGFKYKLIKREPGQPVPVPSVVNWNVHHFAAITATTDDGKYVLNDPTFADGGHELSQKTIDTESSGYFLVPAKMDEIKKAGWRIVAAKSKEAQEAYGMGSTGGSSISQNQRCDYPAKGGTSSNDPNSNGSILGGRIAGNGAAPAYSAAVGMSSCFGQPMLVNSHIEDTPVGYTPQVGPSAKVGVFYNQREALQPATFSFGNLSPAFSHGWMAYIYDDPTSTTGGLPQRQAAGGGGWIQPGGYNSGGSFCYYTPEQRSGAYLERYPCSGAATKYVRQMRDGSQEVYNCSMARPPIRASCT